MSCLALWNVIPELWYSLRFWKGLMAETDAKSIFDMEPDTATEARLDADAEAAFQGRPRRATWPRSRVAHEIG